MPTRSKHHRQIGQDWEKTAESFLCARGLKPRCRNFFSRWGEIDLVMDDSDQLVFIEVKYRRDSRYGLASEMLGKRKQMRLARAARYYLVCNPKMAARSCRFDLVAIQGAGANPDIRWISNAFTCD